MTINCFFWVSLKNMDHWQMQYSSNKCVRAWPYKLSRWCNCEGIEMISNSSLCSSWLFFQFDLCESTHIIVGAARIYTLGCSSSHNAHGSLRAMQPSSPQLSSDQLSLWGIEYKEQTVREKEGEKVKEWYKQKLQRSTFKCPEDKVDGLLYC